MARSRSLHVVLFCLVVAAAFTGCGGKKQLVLKLNPGDKRVIEITKDLTTTSTFDGQSQAQTDTDVLRFTYAVESVDEAGNADVEVSVDLETLSGDLADMFTMVTAGNNPIPAIGEVVLDVRMNAQGGVESVEGLDAARDRLIEMTTAQVAAQLTEVLVKNGPVRTPHLGEDIHGSLVNLYTMTREHLNDSVMQETLQGFTDLCPDEPVALGDSWNKSVRKRAPLPMLIEETYTVVSDEEGTLKVGFESQIATSPDNVLDMGQEQITVDVSGEQHGMVEIDEESGWVTSAQTAVRMEGATTSGDRSTPFVVEGTVLIKSYPLKSFSLDSDPGE